MHHRLAEFELETSTDAPVVTYALLLAREHLTDDCILVIELLVQFYDLLQLNGMFLPDDEKKICRKPGQGCAVRTPNWLATQLQKRKCGKPLLNYTCSYICVSGTSSSATPVFSGVSQTGILSAR